MKLRATGLAIFLALGCVQTAHAQQRTTEASAVDPATRDKSRAAFRRGVTQLRGKDYAGARASFEEAYSLVQHPSILLNLGISRLKTGDPVLAEVDLGRFLQEDAGAAPDELASARDALAEARNQIGTVRVIVTPASAKVNIDGAAVNVRANDGIAETRVKAGSHTVNVEADGFTAAERTADVAVKGETELKVSLTSKAAPPPVAPPTGEKKPVKAAKPSDDEVAIRPIAGYALAGVSGVALIVTTVMGVKALGAASDYNDRANTATYGHEDVKNDGIAARTGADVAFVIALLAGACAAILLFTDIGASSEPSTPGSPSPGKASRLRRFEPIIRW